VTLWKWLGRAVEEGRVLQDGSGTGKEPFRFQLPGMVEKWQQNFLGSFLKRLEQDAKGKGSLGLETPCLADEAGMAAAPPALAEEAPRAPDRGPLPEPMPPMAAPELPQPVLLPPQPSEPAEPPLPPEPRALAVPVQHDGPGLRSRRGVAAGTGSPAQRVSKDGGGDS
jgi:hypothetical protein